MEKEHVNISIENAERMIDLYKHKRISFTRYKRIKFWKNEKSRWEKLLPKSK